MAENQIVEHHDFATLAGEKPDGVRSNVTRSTGDQNRFMRIFHNFVSRMERENRALCQSMEASGVKNLSKSIRIDPTPVLS